MRNIILIIYTTLLIFLAACQNQESTSDSKAKTLKSAKNKNTSAVIVTINERGITDAEFKTYNLQVAEQQPDHTFTDEELLQQLIEIELWSQQARIKQLNNDPKNIVRLKLLKKQYYAEQAKEFLQLTKLIGNDQIKAEYDKRYSPENRQEVKLQFINKVNQEEIEQMLSSLNMGVDFKELASLAKSDSEAMNKEPDWVNISTLTPELKKAVSPLEKGQFTQEPLQTANGWQLVFLENTRTVPAPDLNDVRETLIADLKQQQIAIRTRVLVDDANIQSASSVKTKTSDMTDAVQPASDIANEAKIDDNNIQKPDEIQTESISGKLMPNPAEKVE